MAGGQSAKSGQNLWIKKTRKADGDWKSENDPTRVISIGGRATVKMGGEFCLLLVSAEIDSSC